MLTTWRGHLRDVTFAVRTLRRARGWTFGVVLTLALGIGLATAVVAIANALLIRPLPVRAQDRLVVLWGMTRDGRTDHFPLLYKDAQSYTRQTHALEQVAFFAYGGAQAVPIDFENGVAQLRRSLVSGNYFDVLGARALLGRALRPNDDVRGAAPVAVLSYGGWQLFFGGDSNVVGRRMTLHFNGTVYTVVGVMPRGLDYPRGVEFWSAVVPNSGPLGDQPVYAELNVIGRLRPGASIAGARNELTRFFAAVGPKWNVIGVARSFAEDVLGDVRPAVLAFAAAAGLLLLITCINVANLLLVRGLARTRELAVRTAIGAPRARLVGQLLVESGLLSVVGGAIGAVLAAFGIRAFVLLAPAGTPRLNEIHIGAPVILGAILVTASATLLFAVAPALIGSRVDALEALRSGTRQGGASRRIRVATQSLVVGQMALAVLVLSAAGVLVRSVRALEHVPVAVDPARLLVVDLALPPSDMGNAPRVAATIEQLTTRLEHVPGIRSVAPTFTAPMAASGGIFGRIAAEGQSAEAAATNPLVDYELTTPDYFATFGIRLVGGRMFATSDRDGALPVAIVSESLARQYWPHESAIGKRLVRGPADLVTIVGVVADTHYRDLKSPRPRVYFPLRQSPFPFAPTTIAIATRGEAAPLAATIRRVVAETVPGVEVAGIGTVEDYVDTAIAQPRLNALLLALFAGAALALAAVGLFGVMATTVRHRTKELGVRAALGAAPSDVRRIILGQALSLAGAGLAVGLALSALVIRALRGLLFGVSPTDALSLAVASVVLLVVAIAAAYVPAWRAQHIDPVIALRME